MQFVDAHCHLHFPRIANVVNTLIQSAKEQGVRYFAVNATSPEDFGLVDAIADSNPEVIPFYGIHPYYLSEETWEAAFEELEKRKDALRYIGEIGMDKSIVSRVPFSLQERCFKQQVHLASLLSIPFAVHCVKCVPAVYSILKEEGPFSSSFLMHGYAGPPDYVQKLADLGAYFSISGYLFNLSPKRRKAMEDTIRKYPLDRILLESDAPDMVGRVERRVRSSALRTRYRFLMKQV